MISWLALVPDELAASDVLDVLDHLALKGLVIPEDNRFRFLESVRDFAREQIDSEEQDQCRRAHFKYFFDALQDGEAKARGPEQKKWIRFFDEEWENIRAAVDWGFQNPDTSPLALEMLYEITPYLFIKGGFAESVAMYEVALKHIEGATAELKSRVMRRAGLMGTYHKGANTQTWLVQALQYAKEAGNESLIADALHVSGNSLYMSGDKKLSIPIFQEALEKFRLLGDPVGHGFASARLGSLAAEEGDYDTASKLLQECLAVRQVHGDTRGIGASLTLLADLALKQGQIYQATDLVLEGLSMFIETNAEQDFADSLSRGGCIVVLHGNLETAAKLLGFSESRAQVLGSVRDQVDEADYQRVRCKLIELLDPETFDRLCREGRALTMESAMDLLKTALS